MSNSSSSSSIIPNYLTHFFFFPFFLPIFLLNISLSSLLSSSGRSNSHATSLIVVLALLSSSSSLSPSSSSACPVPQFDQSYIPRWISSTYEGNSISIFITAFTLLSISLRIGAIHIRNKTGDKGDPCGTPIFVLPSPLTFPSQVTSNFLALIKFLTHGAHCFPISSVLRYCSTFSPC